MPANLTPQYRKAELAYRQAGTAEERIAALQEMLRLVPKHKGTEHIQGDIKRRLAEARSGSTQKKSKGGYDPFVVEKHGAGQIVVVGMPNSGKSAVVAALSNAKTNVVPFPFATHAPVPGMMPFEDIQIQLVDMPPITEDGLPTGMTGGLCRADGIIVCLDLAADDVLEQAERCLGTMAERGIVPAGEDCEETLDAKPMLIVGTKIDVPGAEENLQVLRELRPDLSDIQVTSAQTRQGLDKLIARCFEMLDIVRIYSKLPGHAPDMDDPFALRRGSTVVDLARAVHREIAEEFRYARIWGSGKFDGQTVQRDHVLADKDVIELHV